MHRRPDFDPDGFEPDGRNPAKASLLHASGTDTCRGVVAESGLVGPVTVLAYSTDEIGVSPVFTCIPNDERFDVVAGRARFVMDDAEAEAPAGEIVL